MIVEYFTEDDVGHVLSNLWQRGKEEMEELGLTTEDMERKFISMIGQPWSMAFYQEKGGPCCALVYMEPIGEMKWRTGFAATEEGFKSIWFTLTKFLRRASDIVVGKLTEGQGQIELVTAGDSDIDWYEAIGFELADTDGNADKYIKKAV